MEKQNNNLSIKEQIVCNSEVLSKMNPVDEISYAPFEGKTFSEIYEMLLDIFLKIGYKVERQNFGTIIIDDNRIYSSLKYVLTEAEFAAYLSLSKILKQGIIIGSHKNHKGRNYETITIAAPVIIDGKRGNVAAVVKRTTKNYYKTHRVIFVDDSIMKLAVNNKKENLATAADAMPLP